MKKIKKGKNLPLLSQIFIESYQSDPQKEDKNIISQCG